MENYKRDESVEEPKRGIRGYIRFFRDIRRRCYSLFRKPFEGMEDAEADAEDLRLLH